MKRYDAAVVGSGAGAIIVEKALSEGMRTTLIEQSLLGGTCLNVG